MAGVDGPMLSVIITVYNGEENLPRTLDALRAQTFEDFELLVVDNGSNDGTWEVIQELSWRRMRAHRLWERRHEVDAFSQALAWAQGTYVVHHGAGDISAPDRFERQIGRMKRGRTLGAVGAFARWVDAEGGTLREIKPPSGHKAILKWLEREDSEFVLGIARGAAMLNREALEAVGGFRPALGHAAFIDIWLRLAASDYKLANVTTSLYTVRFNPATPYIRFHAEARAFAKLARDLAKGNGVDDKAEKADGEKPPAPEAAKKAGGEKPAEKAGASGDAPPDALKAGAKPPVDKGDKKPGDSAAEEAVEPPESAGKDKPPAAKVDAEDGPPVDAKPAKAGSKSEAGAAEGEKKGEAEDKEANKPGEDKPAKAGKPAASAEKPKPAKPGADAEAGPESEAAVAEGEKKGKAEDKETKKPGEDKPVAAGKPAASAEQAKPAKPEADAEAEPESEAGVVEGKKKGDAEDKEAKKPGEVKPVAAGKPPASAEQAKPAKPEADAEAEPPATPVECARRLAAGRAERRLAARLRERSDNYLAWAARFDEWGGAAGEHVRQMWTRALLAYPLNPRVWAFAYRRLADRHFGGGERDDAGPKA